jgi:hypothetical protein
VCYGAILPGSNTISPASALGNTRQVSVDQAYPSAMTFKGTMENGKTAQRERGKMRKCGFILGALIVAVLILPVSAQAAMSRTSAAQSAYSKRPAPCFVKLPEIYLVINATRRHIADWDAFLHLGYKQTDIVPCGAAANYPEGAPVTRLFKGSGAPVYWMENGVRRHIPDMDTFIALGFQVKSITILPDSRLSLWPLGVPLDSVLKTRSADGYHRLYQTINISSYTIRVWRYAANDRGSWLDYVTISAPHQADIRVNGVVEIGQLPAWDVTGEGHPDIMFLTDPAGSAHCCSGTIVYDLGPIPTRVLDIVSPADQDRGIGRGEFRDLNGDSVYEFVTHDHVQLGGCSLEQPSVMVVLQYDRARRRYVGASPRFASFYADLLARLSAEAPWVGPNDHCVVLPLVPTLLYLGKISEARAAFDRLYRGEDAAAYWVQLQNTVKRGRFYVPVG